MENKGTAWTLINEQLRPRKLDEAVLVKRVRDQLYNELNSPQHLVSNILFYGRAGTGKTTLSRILANATGADPKVINCSSVGIDSVRTDIQLYASQLSLADNGEAIKVVLLEECDGFTPEAWKAMRATVEQFPNVRFIANCNFIDKIPEPIQSRFTCILLEPIKKDEKLELFQGYYQKVSQVFDQLGITYTQESLCKFLELYFPDFRATYNAIQSIALQGIKELTLDSLSSTFSYESLYKLILTGSDPWENYRLVRDEYSDNEDDVIVQLGLKFPEYIRTQAPDVVAKLPMIIIAIAEHQDMLSRCINKKIVLESLVFKLQLIIRS
jgi:DNA polymerase III delta prime subunit